MANRRSKSARASHNLVLLGKRVGDSLSFLNVKSGRKETQPIDEIRRYSLARGRNVNRARGRHSRIAYHYKNNGQVLAASAGMETSKKRKTTRRRSNKRRKSSGRRH